MMFTDYTWEPAAMKTRDLLTTKEVAEYLRVNQYTVYRLVSQKKLPAFKVGSQWRFERSVLDHWLKRQLNVPPAQWSLDPLSKIDVLANSLSDPCDEIEDSNRFLKEIITPSSQTPVPHMVKSAHRKYRNTMGLWIVANKRNNLQTIHIGQANFEQDYIGRLFLDFVNRPCPRVSHLRLKTGKLKLPTQGSRLSRLIVDQEYGFFSRCAHPLETCPD
jgi:excisionase family DNA binding protein